jgi:hypothetical protein
MFKVDPDSGRNSGRKADRHRTSRRSDEPSSIQTRQSLLHRLKEGDFAIKAGSTDTEADEVVQGTAIGVARYLPGFSYDPKRSTPYSSPIDSRSSMSSAARLSA